ncbi:chemotaxis protein CheA [Aquabacterium soli]|uniref:Chemotaxis protein CheA n=1 Tax=Aquabacterium soli TaxID=2493092 RepID=A0A3R8S301_9BURK|nr:chemotaxis protein CheA [Aquabacterium soli]RRS04305.1 chemotaxis protein CheA [Aquabacterium soli]
MNIDQVLHAFITESRELLESMETALLGLDEADGETRAEYINAIFRAAHTIKGSAGLFGLDRIVRFTHVVESVLDRVRDGGVAVDGPLIELMLACRDHIGSLVDAAEAAMGDPDEAAAQGGDPLVVRLGTYLEARPGTEHGDASTNRALAAPGNAVGEHFERVDRGGASADHWHLSLRFGPDVLRNGMDPLSFLRYLGTLGRIVGIVTLHDALPPAAEMDPESCYLGFEIAFQSEASKAQIEGAFEFVLDDCQLRILPPHSLATEYVAMIQELPEDMSRLGEILLRCGTLTQHELDAALALQAKAEPEARRIGEILVEQGQVQPAVVAAALSKQKQAKDGRAQETQSIRVDADKLDRLIDLVGELIIASAGASLVARASRVPTLDEAHSVLSNLVEEVRDSALQLRMVKIGATFGRFQRVVHDVARELGKDIALAVSGEDTELDKTVVEKIGDPLTHLVRNAMDHGIEPVEVRLARGKPARGTVRLNAFHDSGSIVIEVGDDGGGLKRERILAKAVERGLVEPGKVLSDSEIFGLIFEPGFSTAEQVTNLSGRGVGMDVVKRNITALRGSVYIDSAEGVGTTVTVRLPLTLAIINGFQVGVGPSVFVVPMEMVEECIAFSAEEGHDYTNLRGQVLPFVRLRQLFGIDGPVPPRQNIVVVRHAGQRAGLVVDTLLGEFQTVIKPLSRLFVQVRGISGSSIRGSGDVALILDVPALLRHMQTAVGIEGPPLVPS